MLSFRFCTHSESRRESGKDAAVVSLYNVRFPDGTIEYRSFVDVPGIGERVRLGRADWIVASIDSEQQRFEVRRPGSQDVAGVGAREFDPWAAT